MKPLIEQKRIVVSYVPYRVVKGTFEFFLQKRDGNTSVDPRVLSMFGGGVEKGETLVDALRREVQEELNYHPKKFKYFARFQRAGKPFHVFIEEVPKGFEHMVRVDEGEYGKFFETSHILFSQKVSLIAQLVIFDVDKYLRKTHTP